MLTTRDRKAVKRTSTWADWLHTAIGLLLRNGAAKLAMPVVTNERTVDKLETNAPVEEKVTIYSLNALFTTKRSRRFFGCGVPVCRPYDYQRSHDIESQGTNCLRNKDRKRTSDVERNMYGNLHYEGMFLRPAGQ